jgi:hypothetical protein
VPSVDGVAVGVGDGDGDAGSSISISRSSTSPVGSTICFSSEAGEKKTVVAP